MLSGGEKARLALAKFMLTKGTLLVLDEPTNHLDIPSKEMLEEALLAFDGSVIAVTHDRYFLRRTMTRIITVRAERLMHCHSASFSRLPDCCQPQSLRSAADHDLHRYSGCSELDGDPRHGDALAACLVMHWTDQLAYWAPPRTGDCLKVVQSMHLSRLHACHTQRMAPDRRLLIKKSCAGGWPSAEGLPGRL